MSFPLLILHPEESKILRDNAKPAGPGQVIQDADDGGAATQFVGAGTGRPFARKAKRFDPPREGINKATTGVYINHFNIQEGDGWFGDSEMQFVSNAVVLPIYNWVGDYQQFPIFEAACEIGTYYRNGVVEDRGYNGLFLLSPGIAGPANVVCNGQAAAYGVRIIEKDGGLTGDDDEFGWRFYGGAGYPFGAIFGTSSAAVMSYYVNTWGGTRSAYLRLQYY